MSKIHEALKKAAGGNGEDAVAKPAAPSDPEPAPQHQPEEQVVDRLQGSDEVPPLPFNRLRAYRLEPNRNVVIHYDPKSLAAEQFRTLRTRIQRLTTEDTLRTLLITSPGSGDGKTMVSTNLAMILAQGVDSRVLLMDCDLRRPSVHRFLGLDNDEQPGLNEYLNGQVSLEKAIWRFGGSSLHVLTAGAIPDNPSELLGSRRMVRTLEYLSGQFDHVVLDAPPLNPVADPAILIPRADGVLAVVRYGKTGRGALSKALETVPEDRFLGLVFNAAEMRLSGYYYSYEYEEM